jgi:hypothetical protein
VLASADVAREAVSALADAAGGWDLSGQEAVELLGLVRPMLAQLESVSLTATRVVRDSGVWGLDGSRSARAFLERATGASGAKTGSDLKLAERLATVLPLTAEALRAGVISAEHALVLSRGACGSPARIDALADEVRGEGSLLVHAGLGVDAFKQVVARWAYRVDPDAEDAKRRAAAEDFHFDLAETMDGVHVRGFLTPEVGEALSTALAAVTGTPAANDTRSPSRRRHDALATVAQLALCSGGLGTLGAVRPQLVVHVDWRTLIGLPGMTGLDPAILQESKTPIPRSVLDRIACDSEVTRVVFGPAGQVLDVGRTQRTFTGPRRRALDARDGGCRAPGCNAPPRFCEGHHRLAWHLGGVTSVDNGYLLCWAHHEWVHAAGIHVELLADGGLRFTGPNDHWYGTTYPRQLTLT